MRHVPACVNHVPALHCAAAKAFRTKTSSASSASASESKTVNEDALQVIWSINARANLRAIQRETAMQILRCLTRYLDNRSGDLKRLQPPFK